MKPDLHRVRCFEMYSIGRQAPMKEGGKFEQATGKYKNKVK